MDCGYRIYTFVVYRVYGPATLVRRASDREGSVADGDVPRYKTSIWYHNKRL